MDQNSGIFVLVIFIGAILVGPAIYLCLRLANYTILHLYPIPITDETPIPELRLDTRVGCPNGLCYLHMFRSTHHSRIINQLGHFPSIYKILTVAKTYRKKARGTIEIIGDGVAHFEPDPNGTLVWEILNALIP
jgi:hypothetical protein